MSEKDRHPSQVKISYTGLCLAIGLIFGGLIGLMIDNMIIFAGGGMILGLSIGLALDNRSKRDDA